MMPHQTKLSELLGKMLSGEYDPVTAIVENERERGFKVVRPGEAPWFCADDWKPASVASLDGNTVRLVLIDAIISNRGAMTRTIAAIRSLGLAPSIIDPTRELAATLTRRGWRGKDVGSTFEDRESQWSLPIENK